MKQGAPFRVPLVFVGAIHESPEDNNVLNMGG